jgi:hypothetical protein
MEDKTRTIQNEFLKTFEKLEVVLGWEPGYDSLHATPSFVRQVILWASLVKARWIGVGSCVSNRH